MNIYSVKKENRTTALYDFFDEISEKLQLNIENKFKSYQTHNDIYHCKSLKLLNPKIWKYKGLIYKLRVDNGKESARVLFIKTKENDVVIIHAFLKSTQKTPKKEAKQAISVYQQLDDIDIEAWTNRGQ
ncbi:type II toxin-antitoxin system RelE/ParE family toxin [Photobacterium toruni]|uniref:type II toxin-antitoxin system RelE/ParE family toxin n=1 Tax=Photobacterium toruni TaxID=1935446 RepID=UPI002110B9C6|nr:type II toxin-antitoxin system RelE/ParE family toxin [Photobacterium toruni]